MNEKIYKTMSRTGACSIAVGIVTLVTGITAGVLMIVSGSRLLKRKSDILSDAGQGETLKDSTKRKIKHNWCHAFSSVCAAACIFSVLFRGYMEE